MTTPQTPGAQEVRTRRVYYISGFDPRGASWYHRLYREEAEKQSAHHAASIRVGARKRRAPHVHDWTIDAEWGNTRVTTDYQFLGWDDIVRAHWDANRIRVVCTCLAAYARYISCGAFKSLGKTFRGPLYSALYPVAYMILLALVAVLAGHGAAGLIGASFGAVPAGLGALATAGGLGVAGLRLADRLGILWLLRIYLFAYTWGARGIPGLDARVEQFAERIRRDQEQCPCDEVLLVGHSVGSMVAVCVAARLADTLPPAHRRNLTLLTLGQCIPLLSLIPAATTFRQQMGKLAEAHDIAWLDMNARADALCFSQANPLVVSGLVAVQAARPLQQVVRPFRMFDAAEYARLRRDKLRLHFQYLMASALPNEYDYFRMTAGPGRIQPFESPSHRGRMAGTT